MVYKFPSEGKKLKEDIVLNNNLEKKVQELEKRIAALELRVQAQQKEFEEAIAFLFDRSQYKDLISEGKLTWPSALSRALKKIFNY